MRALKVGVIGVGHLGSAHARNYKRISGIELVGIHDVIESLAEERSRELGCDNFVEMEELLDRVDAVSIVVPTEFHHDVGMKALKKGLHVLIEKPITRNLAEADELIACAAREGVHLQVGHIERFNPVLGKGRAVVRDPLFLECHRLSPFRPRGTDVDVILDLMIHDIDLVLNFVGSDVRSIEAVGIPVITDKIDISNARITFANHAVANITASRISKEVVRKMRIFQRDAYVALDFHKKVIEVIRLNNDMDRDRLSAAGLDEFFVVDRSVLDEEEPLKKELVSFVESVRTGREPEATGEDGRKALQVAMMILEAIEHVPADL